MTEPNPGASSSKRAKSRSVATWIMIANFGLLATALALGAAGEWRVFRLFLQVALPLCLLQFLVGLGQWNRAGAIAAATAPVPGAFGFLILAGGLAWGRPLRVRGRQLFPELREGSDWTRGVTPDAAGLDAPTRRALEALWLHDAQKEHASVPAFARISWMLAAVGAPAELVEWSHRAALEEIEHARTCFALAAGYGGRSHSVEPMPDLLLGGLDAAADPIATLATESLCDGCLLEDFNADVAAEARRACQEPAAAVVLAQIAREERSHAEFSWALLAWLLERHRAKVEPALRNALAGLAHVARPTAASRANLPLVALADPAQLRRHGRVDDDCIAKLWERRLAVTLERAEILIDGRLAA